MKAPRAFLLALVALAAAGCTATTYTNFDRRESPQDAAKYNALLGIEYLRLGELTKAKEKIERALKYDSRQPITHTAAGMLYDRLGDVARADGHFKTAIRLQPDEPDLLNHYGVFLCRQSRIEEGERMILKAARNPIYATPFVAYTNAGLCLAGAGRAEQAEQHFLQALKLRPKFPRALAELAAFNHSRGRLPEARGYIERYLATANELPTPDPELPNVLLLGVRVEHALENSTLAAAYARRLRAEFPKSDQTRSLAKLERSAE